MVNSSQFQEDCRDKSATPNLMVYTWVFNQNFQPYDSHLEGTPHFWTHTQYPWFISQISVVDGKIHILACNQDLLTQNKTHYHPSVKDCKSICNDDWNMIMGDKWYEIDDFWPNQFITQYVMMIFDLMMNYDWYPVTAEAPKPQGLSTRSCWSLRTPRRKPKSLGARSSRCGPERMARLFWVRIFVGVKI